jgi:LAS superfamily LD-carboxypeptidase LdcB
MLLTDYAYNLGTLNKFPSFVEGVVKGDKDKMLKEYERRGLSERNKWTKDVINTTDFSKKSNNNSQYLYDISVLLNNLLSGWFNKQDGGELQKASYGHSIGNLIRKQDGGFILELDDNEIEEYIKGGYIVEDISIPSLTRMDKGGDPNTCPPDHYWNGEACVPTGRTFTPIDPNYVAQHPDEARFIQNEAEVTVSRPASDIAKFRDEWKRNNPRDQWLDEKKRYYLDVLSNPGLNKLAGVNMSYFPSNVRQNYLDEYEYLANTYAIDKIGDKRGFNPKRRGEWVDELTPGERAALAESKYSSKLQPSYWSRALAGTQELGNFLIKQLPGEQGDVLKFNIPGLTKKEQKEIAESNFGALEMITPLDIPGAVITNYIKNRGLSTGSEYKELPGVVSGEKMANVSDLEATLLNPLTYAGLEGIPELGINLTKGIVKGVSAAPEAISTLGKFITTETPLKNTYKYNPWAFKPNPEAAYRMIGDEAGLKDALESGYFRPSSQGSDIKIIHPETYYTMGVPSDTRKYFGHVWDRGYPGPYMTEVSNAAKDSRFTPLNTYFGSGKDLGDIVYTNPEKFIPINEATIYKQHWLKGYKKIDVPKQLPGSPNSKFQSEIDWAKWNKEIPENKTLLQEYNAIDYKKNPLSDKEKEMYQWFDEQMRFDKLPQTTNKQSIEVLDNFKQRIRTPEGQKRLKELGITEEQLLQDLKIVEDPNTYGYYRGAKNTIAMNPNHPLPKKVVRHEIEHGVQNALRQSKINKVIDGTPAEKLKALESTTTEIDDILSGLTLRREGTPDKKWIGKAVSDKPVQIDEYKALINNKQNATDYFLTGSDGAEKSAFLGEVQQYMMDTGKIPKDSYVQITPEMVKETMIDAMFDEAGGGKYLRLFNIIKADPKNYELISKGLNKMLTVSPLIGAGAYMQNKEYKNGGVIGNNGMFDMTNPNIYKSMLPYIIPTGLGVGAAAYGANDGANYKSGGLIEKKSSLLKADDGIEISDNSLFNDKLQEIADELGVTVDDLVGIMQHESRLNPSAVNPYTGAVGLIQFMPNTAKGLGTSIDALKQMSAIDQLDYVKKFYKPIAGKAKDIGDLYMYTFLPAAVGKPDDFVIGVKDSDSKVFGINQDALYKQNAVFDSEKKGYYTVGDVKKRISNFTGKSLTAPNRKKTIKRIPGKVEDTVKVIKRKHYVDSDKKEETIPVDPRIEQLAAFSKIMAPTSENIFQLYNQGMSSQMKYGGLTKMDKGGGIQGIEGLKEDFADRLSQFINDAKSQGINLKIGSGYRSYEKQKQLWEDALKKYGSAEVARKWVAPPGSSYHNKGLAVDLHDENSRALGKEENQEATAWAHANAKKYGLHFRMGNEPWHIEPIEFTGEDDEHTDENDITGDILIPDLQTESKVEYDDDYSDWSPNKKEVVTSDPRLQQLEAFSKIISPSSQNINMMFQDAIKGNMKKGGFILEVDDRDIQKYLDGGYIVEEID